MTRRQLLALTGSALCCAAPVPEPDVELRIAPLTLDLGPRKSVKTVAYNGQVPGPVLRFPEGKMITVDVANDTANEELVHWHGFHIASDVDGAHQEGTPYIAAHDRRRYVFPARPSGTRWYHSHAMSGRNFQRGTYTGQFGLFIVDAPGDAAPYDLEVSLMLHEWDPFLAEDDIDYKLFSVNGKMLGAGEPIRVRRGQRVLFRIVNASATIFHRLALARHSFHVVALDGNAVPVSRDVPVLDLGPGERVDAWVEMNAPGVWVLGELNDRQRDAGLGIVVEYADQRGPFQWLPPPPFTWDYTAFGNTQTPTEPDGRFPMVFKEPAEQHWTINGKSYPHTDPLRVRAEHRYRLIFDNQSAMAHPMHLHRHTLEITRFVGKATSGVRKDVVMVPPWRQVEVDVVASNPGPTLFHCHHQFHMDMGLMTLMEYAD
jgi:FtsP/CotA-like multicopper oxidase with cupredoxin domain